MTHSNGQHRRPKTVIVLLLLTLFVPVIQAVGRRLQITVESQSVFCPRLILPRVKTPDQDQRDITQNSLRGENNLAVSAAPPSPATTRETPSVVNLER